MTDTNNTPEITPKNIEGILYNIRNGEYSNIDCNTYCDAIEDAYLKLHEENQRLREALQEIVDYGESKYVNDIAREALKEHKA